MECDSDESVHSAVAPADSQPAGLNAHLSASRRRRLQRRRAAAAQLAAAAAAVPIPNTTPQVVNRATDIVASSTGDTEMWPEFSQLVSSPVGPGRSVALQTEDVHVMGAPPVNYHVGTQTVASAVDVAVGANLPDRQWPLGLSFDAVIRATLDNAVARPEDIVEMLVQSGDWNDHDGLFMTAMQRRYVLAVVRGVAGGLQFLSRDIHGIVAAYQGDRGTFEDAVRALIARTGEYLDRPLG